MADREKLIKALECNGGMVDENGEWECHDCPYCIIREDEVGNWSDCDTLKLFSDMLELLREQETEYKPDGPDFTKHGPAVRWKCSNCQYYVLTKDEETKPNMKFCPNCGRAVKWA